MADKSKCGTSSSSTSGSGSGSGSGRPTQSDTPQDLQYALVLYFNNIMISHKTTHINVMVSVLALNVVDRGFLATSVGSTKDSNISICDYPLKTLH